MSEGQIVWAMVWTCCMALHTPRGVAVLDPMFYVLSVLGWVMAWGWGNFITGISS